MKHSAMIHALSAVKKRFWDNYELAARESSLVDYQMGR